jgi:hypothetical protein
MTSIGVRCARYFANTGWVNNSTIRNKIHSHIMPTRLIGQSFSHLQTVIRVIGTGQTGIKETLNISGLRNTNAEVRLGTQRAEQRHHQ